MTDFLAEASDLLEYSRTLRRDFHAHPELGFQEFRTSGIVADELRRLGLEILTGVGGTGVVAEIEGAKPGRRVLVRADMDALPITEETGAPYASQVPGVMHACGHDAHTSILLTLARILNSHRTEFSGSVRLVFQPAEEGMGGAERMIADGILENPRVNLALGLHVWNEKPLGWIGISNGPMMAGGEIFSLKVIGKGGHGAAPHLAIDPILASAQIVLALQSIVARNTEPLKAAVVSVCTIRAGEAFNVIPPSVEMTGTIRTFENNVRDKVLETFNNIVTSTATSLGCKVEINLQRLTPAVINDPTTASVVQNAARHLFKDSDLETTNYQTMGSEDMAYILEKIPGCFIFMGSANPAKGFSSSHHHPKFDIDEDVLPRAVALLAQSVVDLLADKPRH